MKKQLLLILTIVLTIESWDVPSGHGSCPYQCQCKFEYGREIVDCSNQPQFFATKSISGTRSFNFSGNSVPILRNSVFDKLNLINLEKLYMNHCNISEIQYYAFYKLTDMLELELSGNKLTTIPTNQLSFCPSLFKLDLSKNPIKMIPNAAFESLKFLNVLNLEGCQIAHISQQSFKGLRNLEYLNLDHNRLKYLETFDLPMPLANVKLQHNPWHCDNKICYLKYWFENINVSEFDQPTCKGPEELKSMSIKKMSYSTINCSSEIIPSHLEFDIGKTVNVTLSCQAVTETSNLTWSYSIGTVHKTFQNNTENPRGVFAVFYSSTNNSQRSKTTLFLTNRNLAKGFTVYCDEESNNGMKISTSYSIATFDMERFAEEYKYVMGIIITIFVLTILPMCLFCCGYTICIKFKNYVKKRDGKVAHYSGDNRLYYLSKTFWQLFIPDEIDDTKKDGNNSKNNDGNRTKMHQHQPPLDNEQIPMTSIETPFIQPYKMVNGKLEYDYDKMFNFPARTAPLLVVDTYDGPGPVRRHPNEPYLRPTLTTSRHYDNPHSLERFMEMMPSPIEFLRANFDYHPDYPGEPEAKQIFHEKYMKMLGEWMDAENVPYRIYQEEQEKIMKKREKEEQRRQKKLEKQLEKEKQAKQENEVKEDK